MTVHWTSYFRRCRGRRCLQRLHRLRGSHVSEREWYSRIDGYVMSLVLTKNVQTHSELDLRENQLDQERVDYSEGVPPSCLGGKETSSRTNN
jgi:hypothetical protein